MKLGVFFSEEALAAARATAAALARGGVGVLLPQLPFGTMALPEIVSLE